MKNILILLLSVLVVTACDKSKVYEDFTDFDNVFWHQDSIVFFSFNIEDTMPSYNLKTHFRTGQGYPFHNMYYKYTLKNASDSILREQQMQIFLFDPKTGEPNGSGLGDLFDNTQIVTEGFRFSSSGRYSVHLQQFMRLDTLPFIYSVGFRVEKSK